MFSMLLNTCLLLLSPTLDSRCCCPRPVLSPIHTQQPPNDHLHSMCVPFKNSQCRTLAIFPSPCNALSLAFTAVNLDLPNNTQKPSQMTMTLRWSIIASHRLQRNYPIPHNTNLWGGGDRGTLLAIIVSCREILIIFPPPLLKCPQDETIVYDTRLFNNNRIFHRLLFNLSTFQVSYLSLATTTTTTSAHVYDRAPS